MNRLPRNTRKRGITTRRYEKQVPGHHIQVEVKWLNFHSGQRMKLKRYYYAAFDGATRMRALMIYSRHNQQNAIGFINEAIKRSPFRIRTLRTDNGHEVQAKFHWHLADLGIQHGYIKPRSAHLNGKVERSHSTDQQEFYQLMSYIDDVDLDAKLGVWGDFYKL
jgi:transposase InsO family protein